MIMIVTVPVVLYGCDTWSVTFREERRLRVFEKRMLRRLFGPKRMLRRLFGPKRMLRRLFGPKREETKGDWRTDAS